MGYERPKDCHAEVTSTVVDTPAEPQRNHTAKLTARISCGSNVEFAESSYESNALRTGDSALEHGMVENVETQVTEKIGAMCLSCPVRLEQWQGYP